MLVILILDYIFDVYSFHVKFLRWKWKEIVGGRQLETKMLLGWGKNNISNYCASLTFPLLLFILRLGIIFAAC